MSADAPNEFPSLCTRGSRRVRLPALSDSRGMLVWGQVDAHLPFEPKRLWCIQGVPPGATRGNHGHSAEAVLLILASEVYRPESYIRNYEDFRALAARAR